MKQDFLIQGSVALKKAFLEESGCVNSSINFKNALTSSNLAKNELTSVGILDNAKVFNLPQDWDSALQYVKTFWENEYKVGDYVYVLEDGNNCSDHPSFKRIAGQHDVIRIDKIETFKGNLVAISKAGDVLKIGQYSSFYRIATEEEIKNSLIAEAKRRGFKKGVRFDCVVSNTKNTKLETEEWQYFSIDDTFSAYESQYIYCKGEWAEIIQDYPNITINDYKGEFFDNYVKFECAKISKNLFIELVESEAFNLIHSFGNKEITSVTIGNGTFTVSQIKEIAEYYKK